MTQEKFCEWLVKMQSKKIARSDAHCGRLLGMSTSAILSMKSKGCDQRTALACAALLAGIKPYGEK